MSLSNPLHDILDVNYLTGLNYTDWLYNLRILLIVKKTAYILNIMMPIPEKGASEDEITHYIKYID